MDDRYVVLEMQEEAILSFRFNQNKNPQIAVLPMQDVPEVWEYQIVDFFFFFFKMVLPQQLKYPQHFNRAPNSEKRKLKSDHFLPS